MFNPESFLGFYVFFSCQHLKIGSFHLENSQIVGFTVWLIVKALAT